MILYYFKLGFFPFQNQMLVEAVEERVSSIFPNWSRPKLYIRFQSNQFIVSTVHKVRAFPKYASEHLHILSNISRTLNSLLILSPLLYSKLYEYLLGFYPQITRFSLLRYLTSFSLGQRGIHVAVPLLSE